MGVQFYVSHSRGVNRSRNLSVEEIFMGIHDDYAFESIPPLNKDFLQCFEELSPVSLWIHGPWGELGGNWIYARGLYHSRSHPGTALFFQEVKDDFLTIRDAASRYLPVGADEPEVIEGPRARRVLQRIEQQALEIGLADKPQVFAPGRGFKWNRCLEYCSSEGL